MQRQKEYIISIKLKSGTRDATSHLQKIVWQKVRESFGTNLNSVRVVRMMDDLWDDRTK